MMRGEPAGIAIDPSGALGQATRAGLHDSIWCTWSERPWDARWIEFTIAELRTRGSGDAASIARTIALPIDTVHRTIEGLDATLPSIGVAPAREADVRVPGYSLGEVLGRGSQGTVFRARRERDGQAVALKVVPLTGGTEQRRRVARELALVRRIDHPRIVGCSAAGALDGDAGVWLEFELCRGSVLDLVAEADAPMAPTRACALVLQALDGLAHLHAAGIVHRDIKPGNLLVRDDGSAALSDLGIAKHLDHGHLTATGRAGGTAHFAPREQLLDFKRTPPASDVWSMAATLYFLLTLDLPRHTYTDQSELEAALENPIVPIRERRPELPAALAGCLDRALSDDLADRPADAAAFRAELATAAPGSTGPE
jgi:serine/threonine protein kinase